MDIFERVKKVLVNNLGCSEEEINLESNLIEDLEADSLDIVELIMALEEEFGLTIEDEEAENLQNVGEIVNYIKESSDN